MERNDDVIELGTASFETKGPAGFYADIALGQPTPSLSDD